jgi:hypothetical protein
LSNTKINTKERTRFWTVIAGMWAVGISLLGILYKFTLGRKRK